MDQSALMRMCLQAGFIKNQDQQNLIEIEIKEKNETFITALHKICKIPYVDVMNFLATKFHLPILDIATFEISNITNEVDVKLIEKYLFIPLKKNGNQLTIAVSDHTAYGLSDLKFHMNITGEIKMVLVEEDKLKLLINQYLQSKGVNFAKDIDLEGEVSISNDDNKEEEKQDDIDDAPIVKFIQMTLLEAVKLKVSDLHFEPYEKSYRIRFRLDGELFEYKTVPIGIKDKIASRIKVIASMDISEKRIPQDGRMKLKISADRAIDFRVSTLPTIWGEKIVMRILDSSAAALDINKLGYDPMQKDRLMDAVARPYGMVLVTGPTGSGKTVSLYSCLAILNQPEVNIATAEDPVEINLPGVNQVGMNEKAGLNFAAALKSFLRQDPDVILVGEIRDLETADIAIKAAQTGHMVLSTLHTNDAPKTITRLMNMGVKPFNIASSVILITAQRLARRLCTSCKSKDELPLDILLESGLPPEEMEGYGSKWHVYKPIGCAECGGKGYKGRVGIYQVMPITEGIRKIILREGTDIEIAYEAKSNGVLSLREAGMLKVKQGVTSLEEVVATTNLD